MYVYTLMRMRVYACTIYCNARTHKYTYKHTAKLGLATKPASRHRKARSSVTYHDRPIIIITAINATTISRLIATDNYNIGKSPLVA